RSGQAAALALARRGVKVVAADRSAAVEAGRLAGAGVEVRSGSEEESLLEGVELVVKSPGVPAASPLAASARARGLPIWSEFQLEDVHEFTSDVAVLLNLEPDHLDRHGTFEAYRDAKIRLFERARTKIVPRGMGIGGIEFAADDPLPAEPLIPGLHNRENAAAATAAARAAGVPDDAIAEALGTFPGVPHRLEQVRELHGVRWINDSKATNTAAARRGVAAY